MNSSDLEQSLLEIRNKALLSNRESGRLSNTYTKRDIDNKFKEITYILVGVVVVVLIMVATLIIDSFHINSASYREYSEKINTLNSLREENANNQELIINQQLEIIDLLQEKFTNVN